MTPQDRAQRIRMLILDVDGVLTNGTINISSKGELFKCFNVKDGLGIKMLQKAGIEVGILTGRTSDIVTERARELGITTLAQGQRFKTTAYEKMIRDAGLVDNQIAYMGDDVPDLPLLMRVGLAATPADANPAVRAHAHWIACAPGGMGAVREFSELILKAQGQWDRLIYETYVLGH